MKQLKSLLQQPLVWKFKKKKSVLESGGEPLIEMIDEKISKSIFEWNGKEYSIRNEGFWRPRTVIKKEGDVLLTLTRHSFGSKGTITFANGSVYTCKIKNSPLVQLSFFDAQDKECLNYKLDANAKPKTVMNIPDTSVDETELLMLVILGCFSFKGIAMENEDSNLLLLIASS